MRARGQEGSGALMPGGVLLRLYSIEIGTISISNSGIHIIQYTYFSIQVASPNAISDLQVFTCSMVRTSSSS